MIRSQVSAGAIEVSIWLLALIKETPRYGTQITVKLSELLADIYLESVLFPGTDQQSAQAPEIE